MRQDKQYDFSRAWSPGFWARMTYWRRRLEKRVKRMWNAL
nr:MAG: hypothetical protein [Microvirus sp.]